MLKEKYQRLVINTSFAQLQQHKQLIAKGERMYISNNNKQLTKSNNCYFD